MLLPNVCSAKDCAARSGQGSFAVFQGSFAVREPRGVQRVSFVVAVASVKLVNRSSLEASDDPE